MEYIKNYLEKLERLSPIPAGMDPVIKKNLDVKAFIFDIYGTLLISSSGDIDQAELSVRNFRSALKAANIELSVNGSQKEEEHLRHMLSDFVNEIKAFLNGKENRKIKYPEINVLGIWEEVITNAVRKDWLKVKNNSDIMHMSFVFELLSNRVYPMPGMKDLIRELQRRGMILGIVSNSQFYTPLIMNYFLGNEKLSSESIEPFDPDLTIYSYKMLKAKPDVVLFTEIIPALEKKHGLKPGNALFVGNDMLNDIYPASEAGFKTALFAGDKRSLRQRKEDKRLDNLSPDMVITDLKQLLEIA